MFEKKCFHVHQQFFVFPSEVNNTSTDKEQHSRIVNQQFYGVVLLKVSFIGNKLFLFE